jgi:hypothetical protein
MGGAGDEEKNEFRMPPREPGDLTATPTPSSEQDPASVPPSSEQDPASVPPSSGQAPANPGFLQGLGNVIADSAKGFTSDVQSALVASPSTPSDQPEPKEQTLDVTPTPETPPIVAQPIAANATVDKLISLLDKKEDNNELQTKLLETLTEVNVKLNMLQQQLNPSALPSTPPSTAPPPPPPTRFVGTPVHLLARNTEHYKIKRYARKKSEHDCFKTSPVIPFNLKKKWKKI